MSTVRLDIDNRIIEVEKGQTILEVLNECGINVPTLCYMKKYSPQGACRLCVVEVEGEQDLIPSCSHIAEDGMKVKTHSARVLQARRVLVQMLLANHPDDCLYCEKNKKCELQSLAESLGVLERRNRKPFTSKKLDLSSPSIVHDPDKCVLCGRCVRVCETEMLVSAVNFTSRGDRTQVEAPFSAGLNFSDCIHCGLCIRMCPTASLRDKNRVNDIIEALNNQDSRVIINYSPAVAYTIAHYFNIRNKREAFGLLNSSLRNIGFYRVFDGTAGIDLSMWRIASELKERIDNGEGLPLISTLCPSWTKYAESFHPNLKQNMSVTSSGQQILGKLIKRDFARHNNINSENIVNVSVQTCTSGKYLADKPQMTTSGIHDIDIVITTRELVQMIQLFGIDLDKSSVSNADTPFNTKSTSAMLSNVVGGTTEGILRTLYYLISGEDFKGDKMIDFKQSDGYKIHEIKIADSRFKVAIVNGLKYFELMLKEIDISELLFIEITVCENGCVNGGGQPLSLDEKICKSISREFMKIDENDVISVSYKNPEIQPYIKSDE